MQAIYRLILFNLKYYGVWVMYFIIARFLFLIYYFDSTKLLEANEILSSITFGLRLDLSIAAYVAVIPFILSFLRVFIYGKLIRILHKAYSFGIILVLNGLFLADLFLYSYWNTRIDTTFIRYLNTPELMFASATIAEIILFSGLLVALTFALLSIFNSFFYKNYNESEKLPYYGALILIVILGLLILPMRGGLQTVPINHARL